ncbi:hypothetical protein Tco_1066397 [Tanacetum coccineum]|uniref:Integrase, catalytic region, zinc finger, CCHC-type, peptidase aspartic, catalytic n=1 Tax=Tanacetum coccineum TaxID=301880 RepID=A0ABQ5H9Y0_9ASTR
MLPEWGRFMTAVKLNRGLKTSSYDQLYAYLKQHEAHANENKMIPESYPQHAIDPLVFVSNVSPQQTSSNTRNQATVQNGRVVVQNVQGRQKEAPLYDLALNEDHVFQADQCDAFELDVDEAPTAHTMYHRIKI